MGMRAAQAASSSSASAMSPGAEGVGFAVPTMQGPETQTGPKFGDILNKIQGEYGQKADKPREIKKTLGKDDFMHIMIMQMKNQDPTQPFKAEQFASELAQYSTVEQLVNLNSTVAKMANTQSPADRLAMTGMIGKRVTIDRERFGHTQGETHSLNFALPRAANEVKVEVVNQLGEVVHSKELGAAASGNNSFNWDGKLPTQLPAGAGTYSIRVSAVDAQGAAIPTNPRGAAQVVGVSFEGSEPVFLVGSLSSPEKVLLKNIVQIEEPGAGAGSAPLQSFAPAPQLQAPQAQAVAPAPAAAQPQGGVVPVESAASGAGKVNFFGFEKGKGSFGLDASRLTPEVRSALEQFERERAEAAQGAPAVKPEGFPNGLSEG